MEQTQPREITLNANGLRFQGLEWPGRAPSVLLLHATSFCAEVWRPVWEAARQAGAADLHCVAVDQRGHGRSTAPAEAAAYAWPNLVADALALIAAVSGRVEAADPTDAPVLLVGHSSGATVALAAAGKVPGRVRGVAAVEPVLFEAPPRTADADSFAGSRTLTERARRRRYRFANRGEASRELGSRFPYSRFHPSALATFLDGGLAPAPDGSLTLRCLPDNEAASYAGAAVLDVWPLVQRVRASVLLLLGEHSAVPPALETRLESLLEKPQIGRIAGATHFAALERPQEVGRAVGHFVAELAARLPRTVG